MALKVFFDFDGTIVTEDVGDAFFLRFGGATCQKHVQAYRAGELSAMECFRREAAEIGTLNLGEAEAFLKERQMTPGFGECVAFLRARGVEFHVVSDGLDFYIHRLLESHGVKGVSVFCNKLLLHDAGGGRFRPEIEYPYTAEECDRCACCKRNILLGLVDEEDVLAYVGEGYSDRCAAQYADIVFAKDDLQRFCQRENISYFLYRDFFDVRARLEHLLSRRKLRRRRSAVLKRKEAFQREA
jgi:2-hydroxy-3-keto-5-methylthiopentenyl-1-phosphate phosphatase